MTDRIVLFAAEGFGLGMVPWAPGTFGSLWGLAIGYGFSALNLSPAVRLGIWLAMLVVGIPICGRGAMLRQKKDPGSVVWDEMAAFPLLFAFVQPAWPTIIAGFVLFRIFDIAKPWPIRRFEEFPGGVGIMIDDQVAALFALACLTGLSAQWPWFS